MKILFVCTGNTCRSPMAQYIFEAAAKKRGIECECRSAGIATYTGSPASDNAVTVMKEIGIDMSEFRSTSIHALLADDFDLYVPMTYSHAMALQQYGIGKSKIYLISNDVPDPYGGSVDFYRKTRDTLVRDMDKLADFVESNFGGENDTENDG